MTNDRDGVGNLAEDGLPFTFEELMTPFAPMQSAEHDVEEVVELSEEGFRQLLSGELYRHEESEAPIALPPFDAPNCTVDRAA
jgi:hypothetical protein